MKNSLSNLAVGIGALALSVTACASSDPEANSEVAVLAFDDSLPTSETIRSAGDIDDNTNEVAEPDITDSPQAYPANQTKLLIQFEASWACEVQHRTFGSAQEITLVLEAELERIGVSDDDYDKFRALANNDVATRQAIVDEYSQTCN